MHIRYSILRIKWQLLLKFFLVCVISLRIMVLLPPENSGMFRFEFVFLHIVDAGLLTVVFALMIFGLLKILTSSCLLSEKQLFESQVC